MLGQWGASTTLSSSYAYLKRCYENPCSVRRSSLGSSIYDTFSVTTLHSADDSE
jgi:hypothetical protein